MIISNNIFSSIITLLGLVTSYERKDLQIVACQLINLTIRVTIIMHHVKFEKIQNEVMLLWFKTINDHEVR